MGKDRNQRGAGEPSHVRIYDAMQQSEAWRLLSGNAVKALLHVASFEKPKTSPNGSLFMSWAALAKGIGVSRNTAGRALNELVEHGFLRVTHPGHFNTKGGPASTYRLTWRPAQGRAATNDWREWSPTELNHERKKCTRTGAKIGPPSDYEAQTGVNIAPVEPKNPQKCVTLISPNIALHTIATANGFSTAADQSETLSKQPENTGGEILASDVSPQLRALAARLGSRA